MIRSVMYPAFDVEWIDFTYSLVSLDRQTPPVAARTYAYVMTALYEGWVHGLEERENLVAILNELDELPPPDAEEHFDWGVVATTAAYNVSNHAFGDGTCVATVRVLDMLKQEQFDQRSASGVSEAVLVRSTAWMDSDGYIYTRQLSIHRPWEPTADYGITLILNGATQVTHLLAGRKYKGLRSSDMKAVKWLHGICQRSPNLFAHLSMGSKPTINTTRAM